MGAMLVDTSASHTKAAIRSALVPPSGQSVNYTWLIKAKVRNGGINSK